MSKRSRHPEFEYKRLQRMVKLMELKYQFAIDDGRTLDAERILRKAARIAHRVGALKAWLNHAKKMEELKEKEKVKDGITVSNPGDRNDS